MTQDLDPLSLRDQLRETLARYIGTAVPISATRAPGLAQAVRSALEDKSVELTKGPFLESLPDFRKKGSVRELVDSGVLSREWLRMEQTGFERLLDRPFHAHQERALRQAADNRNFIVATGTGSGKTECFLLPIVDHLLRDGDLAEPGVRAVIIYPLNALANDQLYFRLAPLLLRQLDDPGITFGRFTGQVRAGADRRMEEARLLDNDALREALELTPSASRLPRSWLLSRAEMLETPPHILITNYAMLEHLLLLPRNAPLFRNARLKFVVLDEIHTYAGAQAIEVAFLLRKLKVHLGLEAGHLQVVGTSASLNMEDSQRLARFASDLFGEEFDDTDLVTGTREIHPDLRTGSSHTSLGAERWVAVGEVVSAMQTEDDPTVEQWNEWCEAYEIAGHLRLDDSDLRRALSRRLAQVSEVRAVARELTGGLRPFKDLATKVFPDADPGVRHRALRSLIRAAVFARPNSSEFPILPARYHLAVTGIEGGVVRLHAETKEGWSDFLPKRSHKDRDAVPYFALLPCRNCGEPYLEGWNRNGTLLGRPIPGAERTVFRIARLSKAAAIEMGAGEEEAVIEAEEYVYVDPETGSTSSAEVPGSVRIVLCELQDDRDEKRHYLRACVVCGNRAARFPEPISPMHPGNDALAAVATQALFEALPSQDDSAEPKPLGGRKLLAFSDNRQDAAFFAPFFERTSLDLTLRACIAQAIRENTDRMGAPLLRIGNRVWRLMGANGQAAYRAYQRLGGDLGDTEAKETLFAQIVAEFFTPGLVRVSLEGLGIAAVVYDRRSLDRVVADIRSVDAGLSDDEARAFAELTLDRIRKERAIADPAGRLDLSDEAIWGPFKNQPRRCMVFERNSPRQSRFVLGLVPGGSATNRSTWILETRLGLSRDQAFAVLEKFWHRARSEHLLRPVGAGYGLNLDKLRVVDGSRRALYECDTCGTRTFRSARAVCPAWKCDGHLGMTSQRDRDVLAEQNHYAHLYLSEVDGLGRSRNAVAREHSAVIGGQLRERVEEEFRTGRINLLSCTTTLELGVDLGDLEAIVCKNVPPGVVSYQQRTGRAGRRAQAAPIALTVARNSNYDQACFRRFHGYLSDASVVPYLALDNADFFRRHQVSIVLAHFLRSRVTKTGTTAPQLRDLLGESLSESEVGEFLDAFLAWSESDSGVEARDQAHCLVSTLPEQFQPVGLQGDELAEHAREVLTRFVQDIASRWQLLQTRRVEARKAERDNIAAIMQRQQRNLLHQFLVNALSRSAVIPTYSFPVHTCRLEIITGRGQSPTPFGDVDADLQLDRTATLAVSEYAPDAEIVAGGRIWTSRGVVRYPKDFMPIRRYSVCSSCGHVDISEDDQEVEGSCSQCHFPRTGVRREGRFIEPKGFLTSVKDRRGRDPGSTRLRQRFADEARLVTRAPMHQYEETDLDGVRTFHAPAFPADGDPDLRGRLFIVNRGPHGGGYLRCRKCEFSVPAPLDARFGKVVKETHDNPRTGERCPISSLSFPVDLGHIFETDVRAFAFASPIPPFDGGPEALRDESFLRTLAEAIRLAAVRLLQIDSRDLAATFQKDRHSPVTILFDSVPGGAGYSRRLGSGGTLSTTAIVQKAIDVLSCRAGCASSCVHCLNDYGNQAHWETFDRHSVLPWLESLASGTQTTEGILPESAVRWTTPSNASLAEQLRGSREIEIFVPGIVGGEDHDRQLETATFIRNQLEASPDRKIRVYSERALGDLVVECSGKELYALTLLVNMESEGRLEFFFSGPIDHRSGFPRLAADATANGPCFYATDWDRPLLDGLFRGDSAFWEGAISEATAANIEAVKQASRRESNALGQLRFDTKHFDYPPGRSPDLAALFAPLKNAEGATITIRDPYLLTRDHNRASAATLLGYVNSLCGGMQSATLVWKHDASSRSQWNSNDAIYGFKKELARRGLDSVHIKYAPRRRGEGGHFHDRRMIAKVTRSGETKRFRWDLTSGVDNLMDQSREASVFFRQIE
ncbi:DEAD/DEAH box helicase [Candidatus Palauibacter sp.]|uniref:DEAD/DEAH box helicase n=1 Tax=Candidatus Palauibacter sp. TaxID=3101350 RepID=UPI003B022FC8